MAKHIGRVNKSNGEWSIPNCESFPGQLSIDYENGTILLEIYSEKDIEGNNADILFNSLTGNRNYYLDIIWGFAGRDITLFQCIWSSSEGLGGNLFINRYTAEFIIYEIHLDKGFKIKSAKFCYPFLGGFYFGFNRLDLPVEGFKHDIPEEYHNQNMLINENLTLNFKSRVVEHLENFFTKKKIQIEDSVTFNYTEDVSFLQLMADSLTFKRLLEFSYGQTLPFKLKLIFPDAKTIDDIRNNSIHYYELENNGFSVTNFNLNDAKEIPMGTKNQNEMLLSRWTIGSEELESIVQSWFKQSRIKNIVEYYLETANEYGGEAPKLTSVMINNRFLNLIQGLEDYYREKLEPLSIKKDREVFEDKKRIALSHIENTELKQWLNNTLKFTRYTSLEDKLQTVVDHCKPILEKIYKPLDWSEFPRTSKDLRHTLSHGMNKTSFLGAQLYLNYYKAKLLMAVCLLQALEINPLFFTSMLRTNYLINELFGEINARQRAIKAKTTNN